FLAGVCGKVAARDSDVEVAGGNVDGDILRTQEVEFDLVLVIDRGQCLGVGAGGVSRLLENVRRCFRERTLVRDGDAQVALTGVGGVVFRDRGVQVGRDRGHVAPCVVDAVSAPSQ